MEKSELKIGGGYIGIGILLNICKWVLLLLFGIVKINGNSEFWIFGTECMVIGIESIILQAIFRVRRQQEKRKKEEILSTDIEKALDSSCTTLSNIEKANMYFRKSNYALAVYYIQKAAEDDESDPKVLQLWKLVNQQIERKEGRK